MEHILLISLVALGAYSKISTAPFFYNQSRPLVIAHRGNSGLFPEHSEGAYTSSFMNGADYVELDLQITKDDHLVVNHDPCLKSTFNVDEYDFLWHDRRRNYSFEPENTTYVDDYLIKDFTLAELKMLTRKMRYPTRNQYLNGVFKIQTLEETIEKLIELNNNFPRTDRQTPVGLYIELKQYEAYKILYRQDMAKMLFEVLQKYDIETVEKSNNKLPIIIQSFEKGALIKFAKFSDLPLVQLMFWDSKVPYEADLNEIATYAHGVGPESPYLFLYKNEAFNASSKSMFVQEAHSLGLAVHPFVIKDDMLSYTSNPLDEHQLYITKEVDGMFTEFQHMTYSTFNYFKSANHFPANYQKEGQYI